MSPLPGRACRSEGSLNGSHGAHRPPSACPACLPPRCSAPEVLSGKRCTEKVDLYSFGVVIWEVCTGEQLQGN
jgi:serine/threonine protein kinase